MRSMQSEIEAARPAYRPSGLRPAQVPRAAPDLHELNFRDFRSQCLSVPVILIALLKRLDLSFAVYPSLRDPEGWCFKFQRRFVLEVDASGRANWSSFEPALARRVQAALDQARQLHPVRQRGRPRRRLRPS